MTFWLNIYKKKKKSFTWQQVVIDSVWIKHVKQGQDLSDV